MADNTDYEDILDGTVKEAKNAIRELEEADFEELLELEIDGKNRKTLREWIEKQLEQQEYEIGKEDAEDEMLLSSVSPVSALGGGLIVGLLVGLVAASFVMSPGAGGQDRVAASQVQGDVRELISAGGFNGSVEVSTPEARHGLYYVNVSMSRDGPNGTVSQSQPAYVTFDGELLIPIQTNPLTGQMMNPVPLQQRLAQAQQQPQLNSSGQ